MTNNKDMRDLMLDGSMTAHPTGIFVTRKTGSGIEPVQSDAGQKAFELMNDSNVISVTFGR